VEIDLGQLPEKLERQAIAGGGLPVGSVLHT
jgi:hypothetical protein